MLIDSAMAREHLVAARESGDVNVYSRDHKPAVNTRSVGIRRGSDDARVVLTSLARYSLEWFADGCVVHLSEGDDALFVATYSPDDRWPVERDAAGEHAHGWIPNSTAAVLATPFDMPSQFGMPTLTGMIEHGWTSRGITPTDRFTARALVDLAVETIRSERRATVARACESRASRLVIDLVSASVVGEATGVLMATRHVGPDEAREAPRDAASLNGRLLPDAAREGLAAGGLIPGPSGRRGSGRAPPFPGA